MMKRFKFEISNTIIVYKEAETKEDARMDVINNLRDYDDDMLSSSAYVSDGEEI